MAAWLVPLFMAGSSIVNTHSQARAQQAQGAHRSSIAQTNSALARIRAEEEEKRGAADARRVRRKAKQIKGEQRARAAAQGLDPDSGDIADLQTETELSAAVDEETARTNAYLAAWGMEMEAINASSEGRFASLAADTSAKMTVISGGMQALGYGLDAYQTRRAGGKLKGKGKATTLSEDDYGDDT